MGTSRKKYKPTLEQIHASSVHGQKLQTIDQIKQYGVADFFGDYCDWLVDSVDHEERFSHLRMVVNWYHGQKKRRNHGS